jgi:hypothetical protein
MNALFWLLQIFNLCTSIIIFIAAGFKDSFRSSGPHLGLIALIITTFLGFILRFAYKKPMPSLIVAALPALILLIFYIISKVFNRE